MFINCTKLGLGLSITLSPQVSIMSTVETVTIAMEQHPVEQHPEKQDRYSPSLIYHRSSRKWRSFFTFDSVLDPPSPPRVSPRSRNSRTLSSDTLESSVGTQSSSDNTNRSVNRASHMSLIPSPKYQRLNSLSLELKNLNDELHCLSNAIDQSLNFFLGIEEHWKPGTSMASAFVRSPPTHVPGTVLLGRDNWDEETVLERKIAHVRGEVGVPRRVLRDIAGAVLGRGTEIYLAGNNEIGFATSNNERGRSARTGSSGTSRRREQSRSRSISPWPGPGIGPGSIHSNSYVPSISATAPQIPPLDIEVQTKDRDLPKYLIRYQATGAHTFQGKTSDFYCSRWRESMGVSNGAPNRESRPRSVGSDIAYHLLNAKDSSPYISTSSSPVEILEFMMASGIHIEQPSMAGYKSRKSSSSMCLPMFGKEGSIFRRSGAVTNGDRNGNMSPLGRKKEGGSHKDSEAEIEGTISIIETEVLERLGIKFLRTAEMRNKMKIPVDRTYASWSHWLVAGWVPAEAVKRTFSIAEFVDICASYDVLDGEFLLTRTGCLMVANDECGRLGQEY